MQVKCSKCTMSIPSNLIFGDNNGVLIIDICSLIKTSPPSPIVVRV